MEIQSHLLLKLLAVNGYHTKQQQFNPYNPYIGFQNKENNEYAKNMLKTQQPPPQPQSAPPQQQPQQMFQHSMPVTVSPPTPFLPPNTVHQMPQPFGHPMLGVGPQAVFHSNYHTIMMPPQMQHQPVIPTPLVNAKVGDSVLAKYWEDGQVS